MISAVAGRTYQTDHTAHAHLNGATGSYRAAGDRACFCTRTCEPHKHRHENIQAFCLFVVDAINARWTVEMRHEYWGGTLDAGALTLSLSSTVMQWCASRPVP